MVARGWSQWMYPTGHHNKTVFPAVTDSPSRMLFAHQHTCLPDMLWGSLPPSRRQERAVEETKMFWGPRLVLLGKWGLIFGPVPLNYITIEMFPLFWEVRAALMPRAWVWLGWQCLRRAPWWTLTSGWPNAWSCSSVCAGLSVVAPVGVSDSAVVWTLSVCHLRPTGGTSGLRTAPSTRGDTGSTSSWSLLEKGNIFWHPGLGTWWNWLSRQNSSVGQRDSRTDLKGRVLHTEQLRCRNAKWHWGRLLRCHEYRGSHPTKCQAVSQLHGAAFERWPPKELPSVAGCETFMGGETRKCCLPDSASGSIGFLTQYNKSFLKEPFPRDEKGQLKSVVPHQTSLQGQLWQMHYHTDILLSCSSSLTFIPCVKSQEKTPIRAIFLCLTLQHEKEQNEAWHWGRAHSTDLPETNCIELKSWWPAAGNPACLQFYWHGGCMQKAFRRHMVIWHNGFW